MSSPKKLETCAQRTLCVIDGEKEGRVKRLQRAQWLRAAILGANDGLLSTALLMLGVGAAIEEQWSMILFGLAGALAGAFSMAVGEFVSVSTQRDIQIASFDNRGPEVGLKINTSPSQDIISPASCTEAGGNLTQTNKVTKSIALGDNSAPGPSSPLQSPVIEKVTNDGEKSTVTQFALEEEREALPNPYKAALASTASFLCGSLVPLAVAVAVADQFGRVVAIVVVTTITLASFGGIGAYLGGLPLRVSILRFLVGGLISMAITYNLLKPFDKDTHKDQDND